MKKHTKPLDKIIIHCLATPNGKHISEESLRKMHVEERGWDDIGYHFVFQPDGTIMKCRPLEYMGAHCKGHNDGSIALALSGTDKFTEKQLEALKWRIYGFIMQHGIALGDIYGHYEFDSARKQGKTCPNIRSSDLIMYVSNPDNTGRKYIKKYLMGV